MSEVSYRITAGSLIGSSAFSEASREELRVLLALTELSGRAESEEALAHAAEVSRARCASSLAFWEEAGVIRKSEDNLVKDEFSDRVRGGEIDEVESVKVARSIRDEELASMISECASLIGVASLSSGDVKNLTALNTQYSLSSEFIVTLAAHLAAGGGLTVRKLVNYAIKLSDKGCTTVELLECHIDEKEKSASCEWEIRRTLGIYNRSLTASERKYFKKWCEELGYTAPIISEAYDISVLNTNKMSLAYMDKILTSWHEAGCKTLAECKAETVAKKETAPKPSSKKAKGETPRYGDFDINDAFMKALDRSYGSDGKDGKK